MIDLHTHTTASDGRCSPPDLVARAAAAGVTVLGVTDHDTVGGCVAAAAACAAAGIEFVPGIEITAVAQGRDVHVLGYFIDVSSAALEVFLRTQRAYRIQRLREMLDRLADNGLPLDVDAILGPATEDPSRAAGRPWIARELVRVGHVVDIAEAFDRWLGAGRPAFVPRTGAPPDEVFTRVHEAGGVASLAHPALLQRDEWIAGMAADGLDALEVYHTKHAADDTTRYLEMATELGLAVSGGSDFHGDNSHTAPAPGSVTLPRADFETLVRRCQGRLATNRASASGASTSS